MASPVANFLAQGILWPLGVIIAGQAAWSVARLGFPTPSRGVVRLVAARLTSTIADGADVGEALLGLQMQVPWPYPGKIRRAVAALEAGRPATVIAALVGAHLLPQALADSGRCAEAAGRLPLARFFAELAGDRRGSASPWTAVAPYLAVGLGFLAVLAFITVAIMPKFEMIFLDLGAPLPARTQAMLLVSRTIRDWWPLLLPGLGLAATAGVLAVRRWTWRRLARRARGLAILDGVAGGDGEAVIAERISGAATMDHSPLLAAGDAGDFPALCRACGWSATTPAALTAALVSEEARARWAAQIGAIVIQVAAPLLLALPVWLVTSSIFSALIAVMQALEASP